MVSTNFCPNYLSDSPGRSSITFKVPHLILFHVERKFKKFDGQVITQQDDFTKSHIEVSIPVNSIYTGNQDRDNNLQGGDFFAAGQFPNILFTSTSIVNIGEQTYTMYGDLTIRGVKKPVSLNVVYYGQKVLSNGKMRMNFTATGTLNRFEYGLQWNEVLESGKSLVGETVGITLKIALIRED